jgi:hypothetical protein
MIAAVIAAAMGAAALAAASPAPVTDIRPISIHPGVNLVPGFAPGGRPAQIIQAWRANGNAHSYNDYLVLTPDSEGLPLGVAALVSASDAPPSDLIRDNPFDGERVLGVVRFARAKVNGAEAGVLIVADLDDAPSGVLADHATATVRIYRLLRGDGVGVTTDVFEPVAALHTDKRYCNAELALRDTLGLPLAADYAGANRVDGCFPAR